MEIKSPVKLRMIKDFSGKLDSPIKPESNRSKGKENSTYLDSDFWFHKGVVLNQKHENESAVECYR